MLLQMTVLLLPLLWLPLPLLLPWLRLLLGVWLSLSRADDGAVVWWQDCTEPAVCGRRAFRRLLSSRPCVFFLCCGAAAVAAADCCDGTARLVSCVGRGSPTSRPVSGRGARCRRPCTFSQSDWLVYSVQCVCVCVELCVCVLRCVCVTFVVVSFFLFNYRLVVPAQLVVVGRLRRSLRCCGRGVGGVLPGPVARPSNFSVRR